MGQTWALDFYSTAETWQECADWISGCDTGLSTCPSPLRSSGRQGLFVTFCRKHRVIGGPSSSNAYEEVSLWGSWPKSLSFCPMKL